MNHLNTFYNTLLLAFWLVLIPITGSAQSSGYLGKKHFLAIEVGMLPSFAKTYKVKNKTLKKGSKVMNFNFSGAYEAIITRKMMLSLTYTFDPVFISLARTSVQNQNNNGNPEYYGNGSTASTYHGTYFFAEDLTYYKHNVSVNFKYFLKDNLAPIGKYITYGIGYGIFLTDSREDHTVYPSFYEPGTTLSDDLVLSDEVNLVYDNLNTLLLNFGFGNQYEITRNLFFKYALSIQLPIFLDFSNGVTPPLYMLEEGNFFGRQAPGYINGNSNYSVYDNDIRNMFKTAIVKQNIINFKIGLSYALF